MAVRYSYSSHDDDYSRMTFFCQFSSTSFSDIRYQTEWTLLSISPIKKKNLSRRFWILSFTMGFGLRPRILIHILVISLTASSIVNVAQSQSTAASTADEYLTPHNDARAGLNQGIPSLTWDTTLESYATDWAATRASASDDCALIHSGGPYGENIY